MRRITIAVATALVAAASTLSWASTAVAAYPSCYRTVNVWTVAYQGAQTVAIPSAGSTASSTSCILGVGNQGTAVKNLQATLNQCYGPNGYVDHSFSSSLVVDGIFGEKTKNALKAAQSHERITADGVYGPQTRNNLWFWGGIRACQPVFLVNGLPVVG